MISGVGSLSLFATSWTITWSTLTDWLFTVLRPAQEFFTYMETSPLAVKGFKMLAYARRWGPLSRGGGGLYRATPALTQDLGISGLIRRTAPFSRLLRHTRGCGRPILTRILTLTAPTYTNTDSLIPKAFRVQVQMTWQSHLNGCAPMRY
jgi:hypothetical protein